MHENLTLISDKKPVQTDISTIIDQCLKVQQDRNLSENMLMELKRYLNEFSIYCFNSSIHSVNDLTSEVLKSYADKRCINAGPTLKKAVVWSLRTFGKYLAFMQIVNENPARSLRHPVFHPRSELPEYLSEENIRKLLYYSAQNHNLRDFAIISLIATTGIRTREICGLKRHNVELAACQIDVTVKGGWIKKTPTSQSMVVVLSKYLTTRQDPCDALFVNEKKRPISMGWLRKMLKGTGVGVELQNSLTCNHLRHSFATYAADRHGKFVTKSLMGHQRLSTTEVYTHLSPSYFKPLINQHPYKTSPKRKEV